MESGLMMTGKERVLKAFSNTGEADRVPFEPGLDFDTLTNLSGLDYWEYSRQGRTELSELIRWSDRLGFDLYYFLGDIPRANPGDGVAISTDKFEQNDVRVVETVVSTSKGTIREHRRYPRFGPEYSHEKFIKDIGRDWPVFKDYFGADWTIGPQYAEAYRQAGDRGVVGAVMHSPIDFWQEYRHGGAEQMVFDCLDAEKFMLEFCEYYLLHCTEYIQKLAATSPKPDFMMIHGSNCSASLISPGIFKSYVLPYVQKISALLKNAGIVSLMHICGRSRDWLDMIAWETDIHVMDALERPPYGNVDLAEAKKRYGGRLCLKGNVSAMTMAMGSIEEVADEVKRCIDQAGDGGGFVLAVGDSIGPKVKPENVEEFAKTALKYGRY
jgi:hypothetical protein